MHATTHELLKLRDAPSAQDPLATHVRGCAECHRELTRLQTLTAALRALPQVQPPPDRWAQIQAQLAAANTEPADTAGMRAPESAVTPGTQPAFAQVISLEAAAAARRRKVPVWFVPAATAAAVTLAVMLTWQVERQPREQIADNIPVAEKATAMTPPELPAIQEAAPATAAAPAQTNEPAVLAKADVSPVAVPSAETERAVRKSAIVQVAANEVLLQESRRLEQLLANLPDEPLVAHAATALTLADLEERIRWVDYRLQLDAEAPASAGQAQKLWRERVDLLNSLVAVRYAQAETTF